MAAYEHGALVLLITECRIRGKFPPDGLQPKGSATRVYPVQLNHNFVPTFL
ncbi:MULTISPECIES: hypothetical protein [Limnospira]|uniref:Uncharacterized protein n=2 Tax=Limnospira TaxID=2596745 RepID=A0A9P1P1Y9_9CYAN|nr:MULTISPECIES: hypothetical protein [Limnospira]MDY7054455.1 hypothetical protein [Limnospira fusiformis LS22]QJB24379.1 hypothetical protein HFV01_07220 [Limnospira fusiformis SAG 85.79]UWU47448.1 hypothetical protein APLC1_2210 [Arthrospira platensis C1]MDT9177960.1 hypothetical protein [Limnospira sp. PMC 1238.20]MDT9188852.1 hypothetical protein [Limnospira sp. PMC 894.15]